MPASHSSHLHPHGHIQATTPLLLSLPLMLPPHPPPPPPQFRYTLLTLAALEAPLVLPLGDRGLYGQDCIFLANDWWVARSACLVQ